MLLTALAVAGTLELQDEANVLDPVDEENLVSLVRGLPFDAWVLTTDAEPDEAALAARAEAARTRSRQIAVAVSPRLRRTDVQVGPGLGLSRGEIDALPHEADASFKQRNWYGGLVAILDRASRPAPRPVAEAPASAPRPKIDLSEDDPSVPILAVVGGVLAAVTAAGLLVLRRMNRGMKDVEKKLPD